MTDILLYTILIQTTYLIFCVNTNEWDKKESADGSNSRQPKRNRRKLRAKKRKHK